MFEAAGIEFLGARIQNAGPRFVFRRSLAKLAVKTKQRIPEARGPLGVEAV